MQGKRNTYACLITRQWDRIKQNEKKFKIAFLTNSTLGFLDAEDTSHVFTSLTKNSKVYELTATLLHSSTCCFAQV